jgi:hypothetical protein
MVADRNAMNTKTAWILAVSAGDSISMQRIRRGGICWTVSNILFGAVAFVECCVCKKHRLVRSAVWDWREWGSDE